MATTHQGNVGKTRIKLAKILNAYFPEYEFKPEELHSQIPIYASPQFAWCSWFGIGTVKANPELRVHVSSYNTMLEVCQRGIEATRKGQQYEIFAKERN